MKKSVSGMRPAPDAPVEDMNSTFFVFSEAWAELTTSYRETLNTALNLCSNIESIVQRVNLGRMSSAGALARIDELCVVTKCIDLLDDQAYLEEVQGIAVHEGEHQGSPTAEPTSSRRRVR